jgi:acyl-CoA thioesterase FadM
VLGNVRSMPRYTTTLHNRADPDAPASISRHVPFHVAHEAAAAAWVRALGEACGELLDPVTQIAVVNVVSNFGRELFTEEAYVDVTATRIGTTSLTLQIGIEQDGTQAAEVTATLVQLDSSRRGSAPWSPAQVAALETLSTASVTPSR